MKFLRSIRFDPSDTHVFETAAEPGEWLVPGGFWFAQMRDADLTGKIRQSFSNGFLSLNSFGFSTFANVSEISAAEIETNVQALAERLVADFEAPSAEAARAAAESEIEYVLDLCTDAPVNSVFALVRELDEDGQMHERLSLVETQGEKLHARVWEIVE